MSATNAKRLAMYNKRKRVNQIALTLSLAAMGFGLVWLIWILLETLIQGVGGLTIATFTQMTPPPMAEEGSAGSNAGTSSGTADGRNARQRRARAARRNSQVSKETVVGLEEFVEADLQVGLMEEKGNERD